MFLHLGGCIQATLQKSSEPPGAVQDGAAAALGTPSRGGVLVGTMPRVV